MKEKLVGFVQWFVSGWRHLAVGFALAIVFTAILDVM